MQADALHRCHEFVADRIIFRSRLRRDGLRGQQLGKGKDNDGAHRRFEPGRHARIMELDGEPHEI